MAFRVKTSPRGTNFQTGDVITSFPKKGNKFNARRVAGFDSTDEYRYYTESVRIRELAGDLYDLKIHPRFELIPGLEYEADFSFLERTRPGLTVVDVKGKSLALFRAKAKLFKYFYPQHRLILARRVGSVFTEHEL